MEEIDLYKFRQILAKNKVYDAWPYVESLREVLSYMEVTYQVILNVRENTRKQIERVNQQKYDDLKANKKVFLTSEEMKKTDLNICGLEVSDSLYLRKNIIEFFHYARISIDRVFLIVNSALLGEACIKPHSIKFLELLSQSLEKKEEFKETCKKLNKNKNNKLYKYLRDFDNYTKHMDNVLVTINNPFFLCTNDSFMLNEFKVKKTIKGEEKIFSHSKKDAMKQITETRDYVLETINNILIEVERQIPNCVDNRNRIQMLNFKMQSKRLENDGLSTDYISYFIEVESGMMDFSGKEIKVCPIMVLDDGRVESFDFNFPKIFICIKGTEDIVGCATLKNDDEKIYKIYTIKPCEHAEYIDYLIDFKQNYSKWQITEGMNGSIIVYK